MALSFASQFMSGMRTQEEKPMKLIIDIPEERYKQVCEEQWLPNRLYYERAIANGTPFDSCEDCISRQAVLELLQMKYFGKDLYRAIYELPSVQPIRPKGEWVLGGYDDLYWVCDKCGYKMHEYYHKPTEHFCPNCGADMRGE